MVGSRTRDIDIFVLFLIYSFDKVIVLTDYGITKIKKIIDMTSSFCCENRRIVVVGVH